MKILPLDYSKVEAIIKAPEPPQQLRSFLDLLNDYGIFIKNLTTLLHILNSFLQQNIKWSWFRDCKIAFKQAKRIGFIQSARSL